MCTMQASCGGIPEHFMCPYFPWAVFCCLFLGTRAGPSPRKHAPAHTILFLLLLRWEG